MFRIHLDPDPDHCSKHNKLLVLMKNFLFQDMDKGLIDEEVVRSHIVPGKLLFTRPTGRLVPGIFLIVCVNILPGKLLFTRPIGRKKVPIGRHNFQRTLIGCFSTVLYSNCSFAQLADWLLLVAGIY